MSPPMIKTNSWVRRPLLKTLQVLYHPGKNYQTIPTAFFEDCDTRAQYATAGREQCREQDITPEQEGFFNLLSHVQGTRIDEQRCNIQIVQNKGGNCSPDLDDHSPGNPPPEMNMLMDMLAHSQSRRLDDQRANFSYVPGCPNADSIAANRTDNNGTANTKENEEFSPPAPFPDLPIAPGEDYFTLIHRVHSRHFQKPSP